MGRFLLLAFLVIPVVAQSKMVAHFPLANGLKESIKGSVGELKGDALFGAVDGLSGVNFGGRQGVFFVPDALQLELGPSFSVFAKVWVRAKPEGGTSPAGQIVFRGDDRSGLDNYSLNIGNDGFYTFYFNSSDNEGSGVRAPSRTQVWESLLGTFDSQTKQIKLFINGALVADQYVPFLPVVKMEAQSAPGFSIGNVQNPFGGCHNQPFNGFISDVRLFDTAVSWDEVTKLLPVINRKG